MLSFAILFLILMPYFYPLYSPGLRVLLVHAFLALLKQADGLLGLLG